MATVEPGQVWDVVDSYTRTVKINSTDEAHAFVQNVKSGIKTRILLTAFANKKWRLVQDVEEAKADATTRIVELRRMSEIHKPDALISYFSNEDLRLLLARIAELEGQLQRSDPFYWHRIKMAEDQAARDAKMLENADVRGGEKDNGTA